MEFFEMQIARQPQKHSGPHLSHGNARDSEEQARAHLFASIMCRVEGSSGQCSDTMSASCSRRSLVTYSTPSAAARGSWQMSNASTRLPKPCAAHTCSAPHGRTPPSRSHPREQPPLQELASFTAIIPSSEIHSSALYPASPQHLEGSYKGRVAHRKQQGPFHHIPSSLP